MTTTRQTTAPTNPPLGRTTRSTTRSTTCPTTAPTSCPTTGDRLAAEWARLRRRPRVLRAANRWQITSEPVADLDDLLRAVGFDVAASPATEARLRALVHHAADDELAARVVIQRILPGLLAVVRRRRRWVGDDAFDDLLGAAWVAVRTFNPARRPACLAAALISDADYRAFRAAARRRTADFAPVAELAHIGDDREPHAADELAQIFREALAAGVPHADIALLGQLIASPTTNDLAARLHVTPRTVRNRRDRIAERLREVTLAA